MREIVMTPVVHRLPGMDAVTVERTCVTPAPTIPSCLDVYRPPKPAGARRPASSSLRRRRSGDDAEGLGDLHLVGPMVAARLGRGDLHAPTERAAESLAGGLGCRRGDRYVRANAGSASTPTASVWPPIRRRGDARPGDDSPPYLRCLVPSTPHGPSSAGNLRRPRIGDDAGPVLALAELPAPRPGCSAFWRGRDATRCR
jgi:hypothetical protein